MATVQLAPATRLALQERKRDLGVRSLDAVIQDLMAPRPRKADVLARLRLVAPALHALGVRRLRLFGSVATDTARPGSDIDLIVDLDDGLDYTHLARIQRLLQAVLGAPCDLVTPGALHPRLKDDILEGAEDVPLG